MSAGSCFAAAIVPYLENNGLEYIRLGKRHPEFRQLAPESFSYDTFSAPYGNIYTIRHLLQLIRRCIGDFSPAEDRWHINHAVIDPFRPGLRYFARTDREFDLVTRRYLDSVLAAFRLCDAFIFTLGLTEAWRSNIDGAVFPACPGTIAGVFDPHQHEYVNFDVDDVKNDLNSFVHELRSINSNVKIVLTVSPIPLVATASRQHVLTATTYSKAVLRVAAEQVVTANTNVFYFPAYEIITGPQAPKTFFESDMRTITRDGVDLVMNAFFSSCEMDPPTDQKLQHEVEPAPKDMALTALSTDINTVECEEAAQVR